MTRGALVSSPNLLSRAAMSRMVMSPLLASTVLVSMVLALTACGTTTVDPSIAASADTGVTTTLPPLDADAPLVDLVRDLADSMRHLDEQVVEGDTDEATLARIEAIWIAALPLAREHSIDMEFGLLQSVDLARTAVERRRPADASKGYKIVADLLERLD